MPGYEKVLSYGMYEMKEYFLWVRLGKSVLKLWPVWCAYVREFCETHLLTSERQWFSIAKSALCDLQTKKEQECTIYE